MTKEKKAEEKKQAEVKEEKSNKKEEKKSEKKVKELEKDLKSAHEEIEKLNKEKEELNDTILRKAAEFENYKRRTENDFANFTKYAAEGFIMEILPIYTDLERSFKHIDDSNNEQSVKEGLKMVFNKFKKTLEEQGVKKIEAKGKEFDFNYHEALMQQEVPGVPSHTVLEEVEPGYMYKDKVLKHAKVIVSQEVTEKDEDKSDNSSEDKKNKE